MQSIAHGGRADRSPGAAILNQFAGHDWSSTSPATSSTALNLTSQPTSCTRSCTPPRSLVNNVRIKSWILDSKVKILDLTVQLTPWRCMPDLARPSARPWYKSHAGFRHFSPHLCLSAAGSSTVLPFTLRFLFQLLAGIMKRGIAAAMCLVLIVASAVVVTPAAARCNIDVLSPCLNAARNANVFPDRRCCDAIRRIFSPRQQRNAVDCLCRLASSKDAAKLGIKLNVAITIPRKCRVRFDQRYYCQGRLVPGY